MKEKAYWWLVEKQMGSLESTDDSNDKWPLWLNRIVWWLREKLS